VIRKGEQESGADSRLTVLDFGDSLFPSISTMPGANKTDQREPFKRCSELDLVLPSERLGMPRTGPDVPDLVGPVYTSRTWRKPGPLPVAKCHEAYI